MATTEIKFDTAPLKKALRDLRDLCRSDARCAGVVAFLAGGDGFYVRLIRVGARGGWVTIGPSEFLEALLHSLALATGTC